MNDTKYQSVVREAVKPRFNGKKKVTSRARPRYPDSPEREMQRVGRGYVRELNKVLKEHLPELMDAYKQEMRGDSREDGYSDFADKIKNLIFQIAAEFESRIANFDLYKMIEKVARSTHRLSLREWKRLIKKTLGVDLMEDYYKGDLYEQAIQKFIADNVSKIKSIPAEALQEMQQILIEGYRQGKLIGEIQEEIQETYNLSKRKAELLARDQVSSLNSNLTEMQQRDAGVTKYKWSSSRDSRVRECHQEFDGKVYSWDDPPEAWYRTKTKGIVYTGRKCHPGQDYCCRCCAIPVFDLDTVNLPIK